MSQRRAETSGLKRVRNRTKKIVKWVNRNWARLWTDLRVLEARQSTLERDLTKRIAALEKRVLALEPTPEATLGEVKE